MWKGHTNLYAIPKLCEYSENLHVKIPFERHLDRECFTAQQLDL